MSGAPLRPFSGGDALDRALDRTLAALADPRRRGVVELLRQEPRRAGELAALLGVTAPIMSRSLRELREADLVEEAHPSYDARVRVYSLKAERMAELKAWLEETERLWTAQLTAFKAHLERPPGPGATAPDRGGAG